MIWSRIRSRNRMRYSEVRICGSGSVPKCHGSATLVFCLLMEGSGFVLILTDPDPRVPKHTDSTDPRGSKNMDPRGPKHADPRGLKPGSLVTITCWDKLMSWKDETGRVMLTGTFGSVMPPDSPWGPQHRKQFNTWFETAPKSNTD